LIPIELKTMPTETNSEQFTQKDLLQHLLHAAQHSVTREEMASQFAQAERANRERFDQVDKQFEQVNRQFEQVDRRFEQVDKRFDELKWDIKEQGKKHDRLSWTIFAGMLAIFFKDVIVKILS